MRPRAYSLEATMKVFTPSLALAALAALAGCGGSDEPSRPPGPNEIVMTEYEFTPRAATVERRTELTVRNEGEIAHNLKVTESSADDELAGTDSFLGGRSKKLQLDLPAGRYAIVCTVPGHEQLGMVGTLRVR
jgi:plastocyanin